MNIKACKHFLSSSNIPFFENEPMSAHTTFKIGGAAALFVVPDTVESFIDASLCVKQFSVPSYVLGRGSNVLFDDNGFAGAVISTEKLSECTADGRVLCCHCGTSFTAAAIAARNMGLSGLEFAYGIPGSVGGAVYMNAGAYGGAVSDVLIESTYYDTLSAATVTIPLEKHCFGYRDSMYRAHPERIVLSAKFSLLQSDKTQISDTMNSYMKSRKEKQPLEYPSAGSVFKRAAGHYTGQMIEELGLKGYAVGGACISEKHAGFIINTGGATSSDVLSLIEYIKEKVYKGFGVELETELVYVK